MTDNRFVLSPGGYRRKCLIKFHSTDILWDNSNNFTSLSLSLVETRFGKIKLNDRPLVRYQPAILRLIEQFIEQLLLLLFIITIITITITIITIITFIITLLLYYYYYKLYWTIIIKIRSLYLVNFRSSWCFYCSKNYFNHATCSSNISISIPPAHFTSEVMNVYIVQRVFN